MPLNGLVIKIGATTYAAPTGGVSTTFSDDKSAVAGGGIHTIDASDLNFFTRKDITYRGRQPKVLTDGTIQKAKRSASLAMPKTKADGSLIHNVVRCEIEVDPETTDAEVVSLLLAGVQLCGESGTQLFWKTGSMA